MTQVAFKFRVLVHSDLVEGSRIVGQDVEDVVDQGETPKMTPDGLGERLPHVQGDRLQFDPQALEAPDKRLYRPA